MGTLYLLLLALLFSYGAHAKLTSLPPPKARPLPRAGFCRSLAQWINAPPPSSWSSSSLFVFVCLFFPAMLFVGLSARWRWELLVHSGARGELVGGWYQDAKLSSFSQSVILSWHLVFKVKQRKNYKFKILVYFSPFIFTRNARFQCTENI